jgi:pimeloyl-ACP methyl ester carboxylesterase
MGIRSSEQSVDAGSPPADTGAMRPPPSPVAVVTLNGARLAFQQFAGANAHTTIVLVAGAASSMDWWDDGFCQLLADGTADSGPRRVFRYDLRDTGQSETVPPGHARYTGSDLVDDLAAFIEYLGVPQTHVVGLSMGGALVQQLALARPEMLGSISLLSTSPISAQVDALPPPAERLAASFGATAPETDWTDQSSVGAAFVDSEKLYSGSIPVDEARIRRIATVALSRTPSPDSASNHFTLNEGTKLRTDIGSIAIPTLVVHGSDDPLFPLPHGERLAELIPGARLVVVPGMGHQFPPPPVWPQVVGEILAHTTTAERRQS